MEYMWKLKNNFQLKEVIYIYYVVDRIEGNIAVLYDENKEKSDILLKELNQNVKEGDWLIFDNDEYQIDEEMTNKMRKRNSDLLKKLMNKG